MGLLNVLRAYLTIR